MIQSGKVGSKIPNNSNPKSFAHNSTKFNLEKMAAKRHVKQKDMAYFLPFGTELLFPLFKEENFLNYLFVRHVRSSMKRGCISNSDIAQLLNSVAIQLWSRFTSLHAFEILSLLPQSCLSYPLNLMAVIHCTCF